MNQDKINKNCNKTISILLGKVLEIRNSILLWVLLLVPILFGIIGYFMTAPIAHTDLSRNTIDLLVNDARFRSLKELLDINDYVIESIFKYSAPAFLTLAVAGFSVHFLNEKMSKIQTDAKVKESVDSIISTMASIVGKGFFATYFFIVSFGWFGLGTALKLMVLQGEAGLRPFIFSLTSSIALIILGVIAFRFIVFDSKRLTTNVAVSSLLIFFIISGYNGYQDIKEKFDLLNATKSMYCVIKRSENSCSPEKS